MKILGVIPARYASTRFPAKALADIRGKSMIQRVYEQACKANSLSTVVVATDHEEVHYHVKSFGGKVLMTSSYHKSGTDRCNEALGLMEEDYDFLINIQGDEPFIDPSQIDLLASSLKEGVEIGTLAREIQEFSALEDNNNVKVIFDTHLRAIYFSRQPIPFIRGVVEENWLNHHLYYQHVGIYAFRTDVLAKITALPTSSLEEAESLEQLRWLENGFHIDVAITEKGSYGIDTPEDLERALNDFK
jgi:3-deoxy-manno-octulosonate cytidylyltransferase (CMP-KDO synthetase)